MQLAVGGARPGGAGGGGVRGRVVFGQGGPPGETVEAEITHRRKDFWRAQATAVLEPAATRVDPPCPYFKAGCGGRQLPYLASPAQLVPKRQGPDPALQRARPAVSLRRHRGFGDGD